MIAFFALLARRLPWLRMATPGGIPRHDHGGGHHFLPHPGKFATGMLTILMFGLPENMKSKAKEFYALLVFSMCVISLVVSNEPIMTLLA